MEFSSAKFNKAVEAFAALPGIGKKSAARLALHLLKMDSGWVEQFGNALVSFRKDIMFCKQCFCLSDEPLCKICCNNSRNRKIICIVEDVRDVIAIENTGQYNGLYHVLNGKISPMDGIGPEDLNIQQLELRTETEEPDELIFALSGTVEGDTTAFYLYKKFLPYGVSISTIARGVAVGEDLEYTDEITLGRSIVQRMAFKG